MFRVRVARHGHDGVRAALHARAGGHKVPGGGLPAAALAGRHHDHQGRQGARPPHRGRQCRGPDEDRVQEQPEEQHGHNTVPGETGAVQN